MGKRSQDTASGHPEILEDKKVENWLLNLAKHVSPNRPIVVSLLIDLTKKEGEEISYLSSGDAASQLDWKEIPQEEDKGSSPKQHRGLPSYFG